MRDLWVTATSLTTALNTAFLAERIALFSIVMGVALLLTGIGFLVLTIIGTHFRGPNWAFYWSPAYWPGH